MGALNTGVDCLGIVLTGGAGNVDPAASLGGMPSSTHLWGLGAIVGNVNPALRVDQVWPACGVGIGLLSTDATGKVQFTPPGGGIGPAVSIAPGTSAIVTGSDANKAVRVYVERGLKLKLLWVMSFELVLALNGILSQHNVTDAQRTSGLTTYRAAWIQNQSSVNVESVALWFPPVVGAQGLFSLALETPVAGAIQSIPDEFTPPLGLTWVSPTDLGSALTIASLAPGVSYGLWIRRVFPAAGTVALQENVQLAVQFQGGI